MYRGELVEHGETQQVIGAPKHEHSRALADAFPTVGDPRFRLTDGGSPGSALLSAEGVSVDFTSRAGNTVHAVRDVDLEVADPEGYWSNSPA